MSLVVVSSSTPLAGVDHSVAVLLVAVRTWFAEGADEGSEIPSILATVGLVAVPPRSPSSCIRPGAPAVALPGPSAGVALIHLPVMLS